MSNRRFVLYVAVIIFFIIIISMIGRVGASTSLIPIDQNTRFREIFVLPNNDRIAIGYITSGTYQLRYITRENGVWSEKNLAPMNTFSPAGGLGRNYTAFIATDEDGGELHLLNKTTGYSQGFSWNNDSAVDATNNAGSAYNSVSVGTDNLARIIYREGGSGAPLNYIYETAVGVWSSEYEVASGIQAAELSLDSSNNPLILYQEINSPYSAIEAVKYGASSLQSNSLGIQAVPASTINMTQEGSYSRFALGLAYASNVYIYDGNYTNWSVGSYSRPATTSEYETWISVTNDRVMHIFWSLNNYYDSPNQKIRVMNKTAGKLSLLFEGECEFDWRTYGNYSYSASTAYGVGYENSTHYIYEVYGVQGVANLTVTTCAFEKPAAAPPSSIPTVSSLSCAPVAGIRNASRTCTNTSNCLKCTGRDWYGFGGNPCIIANTTVQEPQIFPKTFSWCGLCLIETNSSGSGTYCTKTAAFNLNPWVGWGGIS